MVAYFLWVVVGFVCLVYGANWLVDGASDLAKKYGISDLVIGLTIVAFGTSLPELVVNVIASAEGLNDLILGNIVGSNNFNTFVILGVAGLIMPISVQSSTAKKEIPLSLFVTVLLLFLLNDFSFAGSGSLSRFDSLILISVFLAYLYYVYDQAKSNIRENAEPVNTSAYKLWGLILVGLVTLIIGGRLVVKNGVNIAESLGVSEKIIGLTIIAAGTSLPELMTSVVAAFKKNVDIAIGNVVGSNILNILFVLSISGFIHPIAYNPKFNIDILFLIAGTVFLLSSMVTGTKKQIDRWEAAILFMAFIAYVVYMILLEN